MQFIPLVERATDGKGAQHQICGPPQDGASSAPVTRWSVRPRSYGKFLTTIFDEWIRRDVGKSFVQIFDVMLSAWATGQAGLCVFAPECGDAMALEHDGSLYACDHYVYPEYRLGNICETNIAALAQLPQQRVFGTAKQQDLPPMCQECQYKFACHGECPKHRFTATPNGDSGLNYLCEGYQHFFAHIDPAMQRMTHLWRQGRAPAEIMRDIKQCGSYALFKSRWQSANVHRQASN
jgi:uncharacterized protein